MQIIELTQRQFDEYAIANKNRNFYQTSQYGSLMARYGYRDFYCAMIDDNNKIVAATLLLVQKGMFCFKNAYSPRGFLIDFTNFDLVALFVKLLKVYLKKKKISYLKIDPPIMHIERDNKGRPIDPSRNNLAIINFLKDLGFEHSGFNLYFENLKPRWNAVLDNCYDPIKIFNSFEKKTRTKIRNAERKGVIITKGTKDDINLFYSLIERKHTRKISYYFRMMNMFGRFNMFDIYFAKIDPATFLKNSKALYENELQRNAILSEAIQNNNKGRSRISRKMESDKLLNMYRNDVALATKLYQNNKEVIIATNAIIKYGNEIFFLIDGIDEKYKSFNANYLLKWKIIEGYTRAGMNRFHFNGVTGDFNPKNEYYGLLDFKSGFNTKVVEYIGEFNLIINRFKYNMYKRFTFLRGKEKKR